MSRSLMEGVGSVGLEDCSVSLAAGARSSSKDGKLEVGVSVLKTSGSSDFSLLVKDGGSDD